MNCYIASLSKGVNSSGEFLSRKLYLYGSRWENVFHNARNRAQYKYIARPVYKTCVKHTGPVAATGISFFVTDLIMHQLLAQTTIYLLARVPGVLSKSPPSPNFNIPKLVLNPLGSCCWMVFLATPVMYAKYKKIQIAKNISN